MIANSVVLNSKEKDNYNTAVGFGLSIISLVISVLNSIAGIVMNLAR